ncbi:MAG: hypothetical protein C5B50_14575 [Verrucomicrobia bacterium]|nr:MAG: hypothetical protein C5B50_14575 [Verrucomicrobiota bacterium]
MSAICRILILGAAVCPLLANVALADSITLLGGRKVEGTILQTNENNILVLTEYGALNYSPAIIEKFQIERPEAIEISGTNRLLTSKNLLILLSQQSWATNLRQIPATVIDNGVLKNVPYTSFRCGEDYEINIYGDPDHPAGIEAGVYRSLLENKPAKNNCISLLSAALREPEGKEILHRLDLVRDLKTDRGLTYEITPPSALDAYAGWWISVYSEKGLELARASDQELKQICVSKKDVATRTKSSDDPSGWSEEDLKLARPSPVIISFETSSGLVVSNAVVKPYIPGVSLIWRETNSASGGIVKLADLPEDLRKRFGYDPAKSVLVAEAEEQARARNRDQVQAQLAAAAQAAAQPSPYTSGASAFQQSSVYPSGGSVYVRGYTRANGTYVHSYSRRR